MIKIFIRLNSMLNLIQQIGIYQLFKYLFTPNGGKLSLLIKGNRIYIRKGTPDLNVAISCFYGEYEILRYLFPPNYNGLFIDAGGYIGTSTLCLKSMFPNSKIIVIEPSKENLLMLKENLNYTNDVKIVHGALVGTEAKSIKLFNRNTGHWGYTVVTKPKDRPNSLPMYEVPSYRLSDLIPVNTTIGLLKLDIEGGELSLLSNEINAMKNIKVVFAELHERIAPGCEEKFFEFSKDRILIKDFYEKFLSIKK